MLFYFHEKIFWDDGVCYFVSERGLGGFAGVCNYFLLILAIFGEVGLTNFYFYAIILD